MLVYDTRFCSDFIFIVSCKKKSQWTDIYCVKAFKLTNHLGFLQDTLDTMMEQLSAWNAFEGMYYGNSKV